MTWEDEIRASLGMPPFFTAHRVKPLAKNVIHDSSTWVPYSTAEKDTTISEPVMITAEEARVASEKGASEREAEKELTGQMAFLDRVIRDVCRNGDFEITITVQNPSKRLSYFLTKHNFGNHILDLKIQKGRHIQEATYRISW